MKKRFISLILTFVLMFNLINVIFINNAYAIDTKDISVGSYIQFGRYKGTPLLWRVLSNDGNALFLVTHTNLNGNKAYDSRMAGGSNYYPDSDIRQWLNSRAGEGAVSYVSPSSSATTYGGEKGFLHSDNFTNKEYGALNLAVLRTAIHTSDYAKAMSGTLMHSNQLNIGSVVGNYNTTAFVTYTYDRIFLLNCVEIYDIFNNTALGTGSDGYSTYYSTGSFLRDASSMTSSTVRFVGGTVGGGGANSASGIRVGCYLAVNNILVESGIGTSTNPYIMESFKVPTVSNVVLNGDKAIGSTITVGYNFNDGDGDTELGTTYKWYRDNVLFGTNMSKSYLLTDVDKFKNISVGVVPKSDRVNESVGSEVKSSSSYILPSVGSVEIIVKDTVGNLLGNVNITQ